MGSALYMYNGSSTVARISEPHNPNPGQRRTGKNLAHYTSRTQGGTARGLKSNQDQGQSVRGRVSIYGQIKTHGAGTGEGSLRRHGGGNPERIAHAKECPRPHILMGTGRRTQREPPPKYSRPTQGRDKKKLRVCREKQNPSDDTPYIEDRPGAKNHGRQVIDENGCEKEKHI